MSRHGERWEYIGWLIRLVVRASSVRRRVRPAGEGFTTNLEAYAG